MLFDKKISQVRVILPILLRGGLKVAAVEAPGFGENRVAMMEDLAVLAGTPLFSEGIGEKLQDVQITQLGVCKPGTIAKDDTILLDGAGEKASIEW